MKHKPYYQQKKPIYYWLSGFAWGMATVLAIVLIIVLIGFLDVAGLL